MVGIFFDGDTIFCLKNPKLEYCLHQDKGLFLLVVLIPTLRKLPPGALRFGVRFSGVENMDELVF